MSLNAYRCRHGLFFHFENDNCIGLSLARYGEWAEYELFSLHQFIRPGMTVLDVGANVGTHAIAFGRMVGPTGKVIAVEAQPLIHKILASNIANNRMDNVYPLNVLAGNTEGVASFKQPRISGEQNFGAVTFGEMEGAQTAPDATLFHTKLPVVPLDSMMLDACDLIKIDVEGMEYSVLTGAIELLRKFNPVIYFEQRSDQNFSILYNFLKALNYRLFWHVAYPYNRNNLNQDKVNIFGDSAEVNILALPKSLVMTATTEDMIEITEPIFSPPIPPDVLLGYPVPEYMPLAPSVNNNGEVEVLRNKLDLRNAEFGALLSDRKKAQEIMESQVLKINELESNLRTLASAASDPSKL